MIINYRAPIKGEHHDVSMTHDDTFSQYLVGKGFVIYPADHKLYAPIDGKVVHIFPSKHAIVIKHETGINILIHLGFGTVELKGQGINTFVEVDQTVKQGDLLLTFDYDFLSRNVISMDVPVVFMQKDNLKILKIDNNGDFVEMILDIM